LHLTITEIIWDCPKIILSASQLNYQGGCKARHCRSFNG